MCNVQVLIANGILRMAEGGEIAEESLTLEFVQNLHTSSQLMHPPQLQGKERASSFPKSLAHGAESTRPLYASVGRGAYGGG